jgi:ATP-dependent helicase STH1/SNF2
MAHMAGGYPGGPGHGLRMQMPPTAYRPGLIPAPHRRGPPPGPMTKQQFITLRSQIGAFQAVLKRQTELFRTTPIPPLEPLYRAEDLSLYELKRERLRMVDAYRNQAKRILEEEPEPDVQTQCRLLQLELLPLQEKVRAEVLGMFEKYHGSRAVSEWQSGRKRFQKEVQSNARRVRQARESGERADRKTLKSFFDAMFKHGNEIKEVAKKTRSAHRKDMQKVSKWHNDRIREAKRMEEKKRRERIEALKNQDEAKYLQMLKESKDERLIHLMKETDAHLELLTSKIEIMQEEAGAARTSGTAAAASQQRSDEAATAGQKFSQAAHAKEEQVTTQPTMLKGGDLKPYQMKGLNWMNSLYNNKLNGILADEMGLGKTIQTIALLAHLIENKRNAGPYLVIVPLSVMSNWILELEKWAPTINVVIFKGPSAARKRIFKEEMSDTTFNVVLTTYEYILKGKAQLKKFTWQYIIIDEGHRIKNTDSKLAIMLGSQYVSKYRLLLTGTPLQNKLSELWALLNFLLPTVFNSSASFESWFNEPMAKLHAGATPVDQDEGSSLNEEETLLIVNRLHSIVRPFMLRRMKSDVESQLPQKVEHVVKCALSGWQQQLYSQLKGKGLQSVDANGKVSSKAMMNVMMQLRKVCNHPYLFDQDHMMPLMAADTIIRCSGKFELLDRMLPKLIRTNHKVLIFSQMTKILDVLEDYLMLRKFGFLRLDGHTKADDRGSIVDQFMDPTEDKWVFLLTTRAGGVGLNLQMADTVIIFDSDWNPQMDLQAQDRAHRIGQKSEVRVFRLITNTPIEEEMHGRALAKQKVNNIIVRETDESDSTRQEALRRLLAEEDKKDGDDSDSDAEAETGVHSWAEVNSMLARSEEEGQLFEKMDQEMLQRDREAWRATPDREGRYPGRLMTEAECPKWMAIQTEKKQSAQPQELGIRQRTAVNYKGQSELEFNRMLRNGGEPEGSRKGKGKRKSGAKIFCDILVRVSNRALSNPTLALCRLGLCRQGRRADSCSAEAEDAEAGSGHVRLQSATRAGVSAGEAEG